MTNVRKETDAGNDLRCSERGRWRMESRDLVKVAFNTEDAESAEKRVAA